MDARVSSSSLTRSRSRAASRLNRVRRDSSLTTSAATPKARALKNPRHSSFAFCPPSRRRSGRPSDTKEPTNATSTFHRLGFRLNQTTGRITRDPNTDALSPVPIRSRPTARKSRAGTTTAKRARSRRRVTTTASTVLTTRIAQDTRSARGAVTPIVGTAKLVSTARTNSTSIGSCLSMGVGPDAPADPDRAADSGIQVARPTHAGSGSAASPDARAGELIRTPRARSGSGGRSTRSRRRPARRSARRTASAPSRGRVPTRRRRPASRAR